MNHRASDLPKTDVSIGSGHRLWGVFGALTGTVSLVLVTAWMLSDFLPESPPPVEVRSSESEPQPTPFVAAARITLPLRAIPADADQLQAESQQVADILLELYPNQAEALHAAAMMHVQFRQSGEAETLWQQCIKLEPRNPNYYLNYAAVVMDRGNSQLAAETLSSAVDLGITSPDIIHHLGVALTKTGQLEEATTVLKTFLESSEQQPAHWLVLGKAQLRLQKPEDAKQSLLKAKQQGVHSKSLYTALANSAAQLDESEAAETYREQAAQFDQANEIAADRRFQVVSAAEAQRATISILTESATVHSRLGNSLEAERLLLRVVALDPSNIGACQALAELYRGSNMPVEERTVRQRIVELDPFTLEHHLNLAQACRDSDAPESAEAALKYAISVRPGAPDAYFAMAQFQSGNGKPNQARWYVQEALRRRATSDGYLLLAKICQQLGQEDDAIAALQEAGRLKLRP